MKSANRHLYHLDLYRVRDAAELEYLGLRELQDGDAILLVEWPERGEGFLPPADVELTIDYAGRVGSPACRVQACSAVGEKFVAAFARRRFQSRLVCADMLIVEGR